MREIEYEKSVILQVNCNICDIHINLYDWEHENT